MMKSDVKELGFTSLYELYLTALRDKRKELIFIYGTTLLSKFASKFKDSELPTVLEQVATVSLVYGHNDWFKYCLYRLECLFDKSFRVTRIKALGEQFNGNQQEAAVLLAKIMNDKPDDIQASRRLANLQKSDRVAMLNKHLTEFAIDSDAWRQLGNIYIQELQLAKGIFCYEELILLQGSAHQSVHTLLTLGQLAYSTSNIVLGRKYHCAALEVDSDNPRALWGLLMCLSASSLQSEKCKSNGKGNIVKKPIVGGDKKLGKGAISRQPVTTTTCLKDDTHDILSHLTIERITKLYSNESQCIEGKTATNGVSVQSVARAVLTNLQKTTTTTTDVVD